MMVNLGEADVLISGLTRRYPETLRPALQVIGLGEGHSVAAGMYILDTERGPLFFADTTVNMQPTVEELVTIAELTYEAVCQFNITPRMALLSYSNFGSNDGEEARISRRAYESLRHKHPDWILDGELQANFALNPELTAEYFPFSAFAEQPANTLIFPNLTAGNAAYKLLQEVGPAEAIGPVLLGLRKPLHILQLGSSVREIVNMVAIAVVDAQYKVRG
jgi:malate dehydrogenase (oxaloacetate-decarboxylating)(NADP+)